MKRFYRKQIFSVMALTCASALLAIAQIGGGQVVFQTTTFGMVGLAPNQIARLNVLNPGTGFGGNKPACSAEMQFIDGDGKVLKTSTLQVDEGKAILLDLDRNELANSNGRVEIRAAVKTSIACPDPGAPPLMPGSICSFFPTLEIFDKDTGKTALIMSEGRSIVQRTPLVGGAPPSPNR